MVLATHSAARSRSERHVVIAVVLFVAGVVAGASVAGATDFVCALKFEAADGQRMAFCAVVAGPAVEPDIAFAVNLVAFFERGERFWRTR